MTMINWAFSWAKSSAKSSLCCPSSPEQEQEQCARDGNRRRTGELLGSVGLSPRLLGGNKSKGFKLIFYSHTSFTNELEKWLTNKSKRLSSISRPFMLLGEVTEVEKTFKLPRWLFGCETITHFKLSRSDFTVPSGFSGFASLAELRLFKVNITDAMPERVFATCPSLETLCLRECWDFSVVNICGATLRFESFVYMDVSLEELHHYAPNLLVFHFKWRRFQIIQLQ